MISRRHAVGKAVFLAFLCCIFFFLFPFTGLAGEADFFKGNTSLGQIPVLDEERGYVVSVADAGALLGFEVSVDGEELLLSRGKDKLKIVVDAVAAWHNSQLIPLYGASYVKDGRWWLDVPSTLALFQRVVGRAPAQRLRFEERASSSAEPAPVAVASNKRSDPVVSVPDPQPVAEPAEPSQGVQVIAVTPLQKKNGGAEPVAVKSEPPKAPQGALPVSATVDKKGELRAVRWSTSKEKVRAVLDCSEGAEPEVRVAAGKVSVVFGAAAQTFSGVPSPYENVVAELSSTAGAATLSFAAAGVKVEKLVLENPKRIVFDFLFASSSVIKEAQPEAQVAEEPSDAPKTSPKKSGKLLVVLDPGHGGKDPGAVANGVKEKDVNLAIGLKLEKALKAKGIGVHMTRTTDVYLRLQERTEIANEKNADMFVSIHANALPPGKNSAGFEIYLMALPTDKDALALAKFENREYVEDKGNGAATDRKTELLLRILGDMQQNNKINESTTAAEVLFRSANKAGLPMKRVAQAPFFVLRGAGMPAVLLETGYLTNAKEAKLLAHPGYQQKIADALAVGINDYLK